MTAFVTAPQLAAELATDRPPLVLDVRWNLGDNRGHQQYEAGHIPGAVWVDLERGLTGSQGEGRHPLPEPRHLVDSLGGWGVSLDRRVVVYDAKASFSAARLWWMLRDAGHDDVGALAGGFAAWRHAGLPVQTGDVAPVPTVFTGVPGRLPRIDTAATAALLRAGGTVVDVRAADRYRGGAESMDAVAGHIPGSLSLPASELFLPDGVPLAPEAIRARADTAGIGAGTVLSCGSGITACQAMLALDSAGITGLVLYPGSYSGWLQDGRPVATGAQPGEPA